MKWTIAFLLIVFSQSFSAQQGYPEDVVIWDSAGKLKDSFVIQDIYFNYDKGELVSYPFGAIDSMVVVEMYARLDTVAQLLKDDGGLFEVRVHTDCRGSNMYSRCLSCRRAKTIRDYFVKKGLMEDRITDKGYSETQPRMHSGKLLTCEYISSHKTKQEQEMMHQFNRRVEIVRIKQ